MARPKDSDPAATKRAIIEAALALLAESDAPGSISLRAVAARAGCSLGTIQYYFPSKKALLKGCLEGYRERLAALAMDLGQRGLTDATLIETAAREFYRFAQRERVSLEIILSSARIPGTLDAESPELSALLTMAAAQIAPFCTVSEADVTLTLRSLSAIIARLALLSDSELNHLTGLDGEPARDAAEDYVARASRRLLRPSDG